MNNMELRCAHLGHRRTPMREAQRAETARHIAEIQAEQEQINTRERLRRLEAKFHNLGAAKERADLGRSVQDPESSSPPPT